MSNEKMQILKMLEERKITADEAARLLQSVGEESDTPPRASSASYGSQNRPEANRPSGAGGASSSVGFDDFANELGRKFETLARDMEPKIQKLAEAFVEKTSMAADKIHQSYQNYAASTAASASAASSSPASPQPSGVYKPSPAPAANPMGKDFEMFVESGYNELNITGFNGDISVKGYNGDKITLRVFAKEKRAGARIEFMRLGNKYYLSYDEDDFKSVSADALVPEAMFTNVMLSTSNGRMDIANIAAEYFTAMASNGSSELKNIKSDNIKIETGNGRMMLSNLEGRNAYIENFNGAIEAGYLDIANMKLTTSNGGINMSIADYYRYTDYIWVIETSNGKVSMNVPSAPYLGYYVKAHTSLGSVKIGLVGMNYLSSEQNSAEAKSINFDGAQKRIRLSVETSNAPLNIN